MEIKKIHIITHLDYEVLLISQHSYAVKDTAFSRSVKSRWFWLSKARVVFNLQF